jgi:ParB/RepB/Spo0J family partition protein
MRVEEIEIDKIVIPEQRVRATFTDEQKAELKTSIEKHGFNIPILVRQVEDGRYELIDGEHRIEVMKELEKETIPAVITDDDEYKATMLNILSNTARGTQNPMDVAEALKRAYDAGAVVAELAAATGHAEDWVRTYLTLTELEDWVTEALREGGLKVGHVQEAMRLDDDREIYSALKTALELKWNVSTLKYYVEQRIVELEELGKAGKDGFVESPPTPRYAQELVSYGDCMTCKRKINRSDLYMPVICIDCRALLEWLIEQLGDPKEAMQTVYNALQLHFEMQRRQQEAVMQQHPQYSQAHPPSPPAPAQTATQPNPGAELEEEDMQFLKKIRILREAGLL